MFGLKFGRRYDSAGPPRGLGRGPPASPWATPAAVERRGGGIDWGGVTHKYQTKPQRTRHRFGHHSGLDESSGRNSTTILHGIVFPVYLMLSKISIITEYETKNVVSDNNKPFRKNACRFGENVPRGKHLSGILGVPIHIKLLLIILNILCIGLIID